MCVVCDGRSVLGGQTNWIPTSGDDWRADPINGEGFSTDASGPGQARANAATGDINIDGLLASNKWVASALTYSFPQSMAEMPGISIEEASTLAPLTAQMQATARWVFAQAESLTGLTITEAVTPSVATFRMAKSEAADPTAYAYLPGNGGRAGDSFYSGTRFDAPERGGYAWLTFIHEIGHALGLKHGHELGGPANTAMATDRDSMEFSVMTYRSFIGADTDGYVNGRVSYAQTFMMYDIAALQHMYGANFSTRATDTVYSLRPDTGETFVNGVSEGSLAENANRTFLTVWDGGGNDTYDFAAFTNDMTVSLAPGDWSLVNPDSLANLRATTEGLIKARGNIFNALQYQGDARSLIENAISGSGNDSLSGNAASNRLRGNAGNDTLDGGAGADTAIFAGARADFHLRSSLVEGRMWTQVTSSAGSEGSDQTVAIETLEFAGIGHALAGAQQNRAANVDGARWDDVVFVNVSSGQTVYQDMAAGGPAGFGLVLGSLPGGWRPFATGDVNGDFRADVFVQDSATGSMYAVSLAGGQPSWLVVSAAFAADWTALAAADFTGDALVDVLARNNATGELVFADMGPGGFERWGAAANPGTDWRFAGAGDFDGDGVSDVALQNGGDGRTWFVNLDRGGFNGWGVISDPVGQDWRAAAAGDLNADGFADVVFHNAATGQVWWVNMAGGVNSGWGVVAEGLVGWTVESVFDPDNDGYGDVLARENATGVVVYADMNAGAFAGWGGVAATGPTWMVV